MHSLQNLYPADSWAIRQLNDGGDGLIANIMPLISAIAAIPASALRTTLSVTGTNRVNDANALTSYSESNTGFGSAGLSATSFGQSGNTVGNGGVAVIRRGSELLANQLTSALGGAVSLLDMLQSYEQTGQVYLGNMRTTVQGLSGRLLGTIYNGANVLLQQLSNQAGSSPSGSDFFYRRGGMAITTTRPATTPFVLGASPSTVTQDGFGFASGVNGQTIAELGANREGVMDEMNNFSRDTGNDGLSSVIASAASPFGTFLENLSVDGTTSSPTSVGQPVSSSDSSSEAAQQVLDDDFSFTIPTSTITNALNAFGLLP